MLLRLSSDKCACIYRAQASTVVTFARKEKKKQKVEPKTETKTKNPHAAPSLLCNTTGTRAYILYAPTGSSSGHAL